MGFLRGLFAFIGLVVVAGLIFAFVKFGGLVGQVKSLDPKAMGLYMDMFSNVLKTGNSAEAMVRKVKVNPDVSNEDIKDTIDSYASDHNMQLVGDVVMFDGSPLDSSGKKTKYTRIFSLCSRPIAQKFLNYSMAYGAFMPCRIMLQEDDNGDRWLYTMDMGLMIHGGKPLPSEMLKMAESVRDTIYGAMDAAATGDF
jgi:uncharacterized protein (DUF302 family)